MGNATRTKDNTTKKEDDRRRREDTRKRKVMIVEGMHDVEIGKRVVRPAGEKQEGLIGKMIGILVEESPDEEIGKTAGMFAEGRLGETEKMIGRLAEGSRDEETGKMI